MTSGKEGAARLVVRVADLLERGRRAATGARLSELQAARVRGVPVIGLRARGAGVYPKRLTRA